MGFYFRKSIGKGPFRINFSKSGVSYSAGVKGARINFSNRGTYVNLGSHGVYYRKKISGFGQQQQEEYKEKLNVLVDLYVKRYSLDWGRLFAKGRYHRVPLPTYPFSRESYWIEETAGSYRQSLLNSHALACGRPQGIAPTRENCPFERKLV